MSSIIRCSGLSKRYWINHQASVRYGSLRDDLANFARAPLRALRGERRSSSTKEDFWALREVSFEVERGDVVGIIGRNGAGKSTLLKILSRITEPTKGRIEIEGRVASLLEVGTGFHPELTGRENIYLNGAILGMSRSEISAKFDEIVAFAEVDKFLDTPVKRFSSGMYVRLAFAVAAHLEPEILIVDEVLAVGDAQFQKKCLGKVQDVSSKEGRTVLFVSHQMGTVRQLCGKAMLLTKGQITDAGATGTVIDTYIKDSLGKEDTGFTNTASAFNKDIAVVKAWTANCADEPTAYFLHTEELQMHVQCRVNTWVPNAELRLMVRDSRGRSVFTSDVDLRQPAGTTAAVLHATARIPAPFLRPETYFATFATLVNNQVLIDIAVDGLSFVVQDAGSKYAASEGMDYGCVFAPCDWRMSYLDKPVGSDAQHQQ